MTAARGEGLFHAELETPVAVVEVPVLERNLAGVAMRAAEAGVAVRPHVKTHKCPAIASRQRDLGAVGLTAATLDEAEGFVSAGFEDVLVYYPTVGPAATERLLALAGRARVSTAVEGVEEAEHLDAAARSRGIRIDVLLDVDTGLDRTGVGIGEVESFAGRVESMPGLRLMGVSTHEGFAYSIADPEERRRVVGERLGAFAEAGRALGVETVSCGATPSLSCALEIDGITEVRPGNYAFMDRIEVALGVAAPEDCALTVLSTVISVRGGGRATVDAGSKSLGSDRGAHGTSPLEGYGMVADRPGLSMPALSEEHGFVVNEGGREMELGERIRVVPNHSCATASCFGSLVFAAGDEIVAVEPMTGVRAFGGSR